MLSLSNAIASTAGGVRETWRAYRQIPGRLGSDHSLPTRKSGMQEMKIRLLLADADSTAIATVSARLLAHHDFEMVAQTSSGEDALRKRRTLQPHVIFIDVALLEASDLDIAELQCKPVRPIVVFLTEHAHYAVQAFDLGVADYLLKPFNADRFDVSLDRVREQIALRCVTESTAQQESSTMAHSYDYQFSMGRIAVTDRKRTHVIEVSEIEWIAAAGDYTELHVSGATHLLREPLSILLNRLPA